MDEGGVVHMIGIGGSGLSAIARVLVESGTTVTGSDRQASPFTRDLEAAGVQVSIGHRAENVAGASLVVRSSAIPDENVEVQEAHRLGIPVLKRADFLGQLMEGRSGVAIAGTHGKTTTTAMIAWMLTDLGQDPSFIVGSVLKNLGVNARAGQGQPFVIEADEYDRMFLGLRPKIGVVTNVEHDHPDCYPSETAYRQAFLAFAETLQPEGILLGCGEDPGAVWLLDQAVKKGLNTLAYGLGEAGFAYRAHHLDVNQVGGYTFEATADPSQTGSDFSVSVRLQVPGEHNVRNALAGLAVAHQLGLSPRQAAVSLGLFQGTARRFEVLGEVGGVTIIDDYAHHPTEVRATLSAARARYGERRIWAVWQPHTYSRTQALFEAFSKAFEETDQVIVTEVYASRESGVTDFSARQVVEAMNHPQALFIPGLAQVAEHLLEHLRPGDVLLVLSAGDADQVSAQVFSALSERSQTNG